jgi:hypothetical protein
LKWWKDISKSSWFELVAYLTEGSLGSAVEVLEVLFCFFARVDEDDLVFLFFDRFATPGRSGKTILCWRAASTILVSEVAGVVFFFF